MYAALVKRWFLQLPDRVWRATLMRSGLVTVLLLALVLLVLTLGWRAHQHGRFAVLKAELKRPAPPPPMPSFRPGGQDPIILERTQVEAGTAPEFLKATLLPGRGMDLLQITAYLPEKGEVQLLASPSLERATKMLNDPAAAVNSGSLSLGGPFEAPWAGLIRGSIGPDGETMNVSWQGHTVNLPAGRHNVGAATAAGGLLLGQAASRANTNVMPDGGEAQGVFAAGDFDGHWLSQTEVTTTVQLDSRAMEMKIVARNTGDQPEPIGLGWRPQFAILGNRASVRLRLPSDVRTEVKDRKSGLPTGKLLTATRGEYDFTQPNGAPLGSLGLDETFVHLRQGLLENGPTVEVRDPENHYGLRITTLTSTIKALQVYAPADKSFISISPQFNYDDPFGREWPADEDTGMVTLAPGQSATWRIRLEIFPLTAVDRSHL
ncbi:aldose epimerase family protein [Edaphobacter bradus]|uniref:aldose epimerase family protein n=1 Tax=Edaphobacter bradus TaxID=2259016 RepID=UPI0021E0BCF9|nr:hypothetical protein [Edaphobacter bradus]